MSITVIIINYNSGTLLYECLEMLSCQSLQPSRVVVVDNGSLDGSAKCVEQYRDVILQVADSNLGFAAGNNHALFECDTEFVALLNPDALPETEWLEHLVAAAKLMPEVAAFGSLQISAESHDLLDGIGDVYHISGLVWRDGHGKQRGKTDSAVYEIFSPCAAAALYRREALIEVGGFDEDFFCYVEDVDLGFRLRLAGHKAMVVPNAVVHHLGSATTGGRHSDFSLYHGHRNLVWAFVKSMPGVLFWVMLPLHLALNLFSVIWFSLRGHGWVILKAKRDAIMGLPSMWRKRQLIQANRHVSLLDIWHMLDKRLWPSFDSLNPRNMNETE